MQHLTEGSEDLVLCEAGSQVNLTQHINRSSFQVESGMRQVN